MGSKAQQASVARDKVLSLGGKRCGENQVIFRVGRHSCNVDSDRRDYRLILKERKETGDLRRGEAP